MQPSAEQENKPKLKAEHVVAGLAAEKYVVSPETAGWCKEPSDGICDYYGKPNGGQR